MAEFGETQERAKRSYSLGSALLTTVIVLLLAALTWAALFVAPQYPQWPLRLRFNTADAPAWFAAIVASFSIVAFYLLNRVGNTRGAEQAISRLGKMPSARGEIVKLHLDLDLKAASFAERYKHIADGKDEMMLVCREVPPKGDKTYSTDDIREQIKFLKSNPALRMRVKWAVFVTHENEFVAFQNFDTFLAFVLNEQAAPYREALNKRDAGEFKNDFFAMERDEAVKSFTPDGPAVDSNVRIFGLNIHCVEQGWSRRRMIEEMDKKQTDEAMVVGKAKKVVGIVRRADLVDTVLGAML